MPRIFDDGRGFIGAIQSSVLTEAQIQTAYGVGWILADGRSVTGSQYALISGNAAVPDLRGVVLRGKNNARSDGNENPDGEMALGSFQGSTFGSHSHIGTTNPQNTDHSHRMFTTETAGNGQGTPAVNVQNGAVCWRALGPPGGGDYQMIFSGAGNTNPAAVSTGITSYTSANHAHDFTSNIVGGNETRMKNVTVNHFIRIN